MRARAKAGTARLGLLLCVLAGLFIPATPAYALHTHPFKETFGSAEHPPLKSVTDAGIDPANGDLLVVDPSSGGISRWNPDGTPAPFSALGTNLIDGKKGPGGKACASEPASCDETPQNGLSFGFGAISGEPTGAEQLSVAPPGAASGTGGDIYLAQPNKRLVDVFASSGKYLGQIAKYKEGATEKKFEEPRGVAVDAAGTVYVADAGANEGLIYKFVPSANPPLPADLAAKFTGEPFGRIAAGYGPTAGSLFMVALGENGAAVSKLDANTGALDYNFHTGEVRRLDVDPADGHLFVAASGAVGEWDASGSLAASHVSTIQRGAAGIAFSGGNIFLGGGKEVAIYGPSLVIYPDVAIPYTEPEPPTVGPTGGALHGTVNPDGSVLTGCHFEYDTTPYNIGESPHGTSVPCDKTPAEIGSGSSPVAISAELSGLKPGTHYFFALRAENAEGHASAAASFSGGVLGGFARFTTLSPALTQPATEVKGTTATLNAEVDPFGVQLEECRFEYGPTTSYGHTAPCDKTPAEIGSGESFVAVHAHVSGLVPNGTAYHFRVVAKSPTPPAGYGAFDGEDAHFATASTFTVASGEATNIGASAATLNGTVDPGGEALTECAFEWGETAAYGHTVPCAETPAEIGSGESPVAVHADISGLELGSEYHFRLIAADAGGSGQGADKSFRTLGPLIAGQWASGVVHTEATLKAEIDPGGAATTFQLEYGPTAAYGQSTAPSSAGSDSSTHTLGALLEGLQPGHTYHYRFTATSHCEAAHPAAECTVIGPDATFYTYPNFIPTTECPNQALRAAASYLPDCRAYEMVSPPEKNGADIIGGATLNSLVSRGSFEQAAADGEKITYSSTAAFAGEESASVDNQYLSTRTAAGWVTHGINPPTRPSALNDLCFPVDVDSPFQAFTEDLSSAWLVNDSVPLTPNVATGYVNLYRRDNSGAGLEALSIGTPSFATAGCYNIEFRAASADLSDQYFVAGAKLTPDAAATSREQVYDLAGGALHLVSVLPDGSPAAGGSGVGTGGAINTGGTNSRVGSVRDAVSSDGSRVYWSSITGPGSDTTLFLRRNPAQPQSAISAGHCTEAAKACTIAVSAAAQGVTFWAANPSGSEAIYSQGAGLYRFDLATESSTPIAGESPGLLGASEDLSRLYFVSREDLAPGANAGEDNLYLDHEGALSFIAALSPRDVTADGHSPSAVEADPFYRDSRVSPDGRHLAFMSNRSLTGYDNADAQTGEADEEVYLYEAGGELHCASCDPSGARPQGQLLRSPYVGNHGPGSLTSELAAAWIPTSEHELHASNVLSADGSRLFFNSFDALLPTDTNGAQDVYEWEAPGTGGPGGCHESDGDYFVSDGGCISLISSGESPRESEFVDASTDGRDAFIRTESSFDPRDEGSLDIYDARENGGFAVPTVPAACEGEACQSPPPVPDDPTPASAAFEGAGNVVEEALAPTPARCSKGKVRRHGKCAAKKHRKRANRKRGAGR